MLAAERINFNREMGALQAKCAEAEAKVSEARTNSDRLQKAASAADQKVSKLGMELKAKVCLPNGSILEFFLRLLRCPGLSRRMSCTPGSLFPGEDEKYLTGGT